MRNPLGSLILRINVRDRHPKEFLTGMSETLACGVVDIDKSGRSADPKDEVGGTVDGDLCEMQGLFGTSDVGHITGHADKADDSPGLVPVRRLDRIERPKFPTEWNGRF